MSYDSPALIDDWLHDFATHHDVNSQDDPHYYNDESRELVTSCIPVSFELGTGEQLLGSLLQKCALAQHEVLLVTCFWARSASQRLISSFLQSLSARACAESRIIRVRICFSSQSIWQKLFQTSSLLGRVWHPSTWEHQLGLPPPSDLQGLDLTVKSVFVRPFSVMHPKFVVLDRQKAFLPSCNVSWEDWFEGCIEFEGELVVKLFRFWQMFWDRAEFLPKPRELQGPDSTVNVVVNTSAPAAVNSFPRYSPSNVSTTNLFGKQFEKASVSALLLPSPHHSNPGFRPLVTTPSIPPPTPLNTFLLHVFSVAKHSIYIQTPNVTSEPVLSALFAALKNGVDVQLITSSKLMILEQLATAGTITELALWSFQRRYRHFLERENRTRSSQDVEALRGRPGTLTISYYHPMDEESSAEPSAEEPVKSHLKLTIVDEEIVVLGSGNMDRASWFSSQELGVAFFSRSLARDIRAGIQAALSGRTSTRVTAPHSEIAS
ncbi:MAG: hypothetical protein M1818_000568 [Claussenomyces sp. TS43310]|nr:MAG: hypothetical protein M1818_000568 [Claussenomyces sp. TS43310]